MLKPKRSNHCLIFATVIGGFLSLLTVILLFLAYQNYSERSYRNRIYHEIGEDISSRVEIGDKREKVFQAMGDAGAWHSIKCREIEKDVIHDLFYFGLKDKNKVFVFGTTSAYHDGEYVLASVGNYGDSMSINDIPEMCLPPEFR